MKPILSAMAGNKVSPLPIWFFRQAGRYLPEYQELKSKHSFLELLSTPHLAKEVTMQPIKRFGLDAAIIFSDILTPLAKLGIEVDFELGAGPKLILPASLEEVSKGGFESKNNYCAATTNAISETAEALSGKDTTLLGFCGAPFTLLCYLLSAESKKLGSKNSPLDPFAEVKLSLLNEEWVNPLLNRIEDVMLQYLSDQHKAGAEALVIFDSWAMVLSPSLWRDMFAERYKRFLDRLNSMVSCPVCLYVTNTINHIDAVSTLNLKSLAVDWRSPLKEVADALPGVCLQGNIDPSLLTGHTPYLEKSVEEIISVFKARSNGSGIFNVGHGLVPSTNIEVLSKVISHVRALS